MTPSPSRTSAAVLAASILVSLLAAACGGGGGGGGGAASPTPSPTAGGGATSPDPSAPASAAVASPAASGGGGGSTSGSKTPPDDACSVITDTDVKEIFGGDVEAVPNDDDEDNSCSFSVTNGNGLVEDSGATTPQIVSVTFDEGWISYEDERKAFGEGVAKVDGLGRDAWIGLGAIHADLGEDNEMVTTTIFGAIYDPTVIEGERYALAKLVLGRL